MSNRRDFLGASALGALGLLSPERANAAPALPSDVPWNRLLGPRPDAGIPVPVHTPDIEPLPFELDGNTKVFRLVADVSRRTFLPGWTFDVWGYNGGMPGPTIEVMEGDTVRVVVENRLPEITSMHWHGIEVPIAMDGVPGVTQDPIPPGGTFTYEFTLHQHGTFFYHSHMAMQEMMGMIGLFIVHPRTPYAPTCDRDFALVLQEWGVLPNNSIPNSMAMEFNWLTLNGRSGPHTTPLIVRRGERVRIRFVNLGMDHHPMHLHGHTWVTTGTEGGRVPQAAWTPGNTELVGVAQARDVEFVASNPGDWMLHCHLPHHMMNHMASLVGPRSHPTGMRPGGGMPEGMGMSTGGAMDASNGPSMGRAIGLGAMRHRQVSHLVAGAGAGEQEHAGHAVAGQGGAMVPGFPQDHVMAMDAMVDKPETYGMRSGWSGGVMGMMTVVRVLDPEVHDEVQRLRAAADGEAGR